MKKKGQQFVLLKKLQCGSEWRNSKADPYRSFTEDVMYVTLTRRNFRTTPGYWKSNAMMKLIRGKNEVGKPDKRNLRGISGGEVLGVTKK